MYIYLQYFLCPGTLVVIKNQRSKLSEKCYKNTLMLI